MNENRTQVDLVIFESVMVRHERQLMEALQLLAPRMYAATIDKIRAVP